jgi:hypothetical protein
MRTTAIFNREEEENYACIMREKVPYRAVVNPMAEGLVQFEVEIQSQKEIRSRVIWSDAESPWIEGGMEELMVHFTYASWTAYNLGFALSMVIASKNESLGQAISDMMTKTISKFGAVQIAEIQLTREALDELRRDNIEP